MAEEKEKKGAKIIAKAMSDEAFKNELKANPRKVLAEEGIEVPESKEIKVVENTRDEAYLVIPYAEEGLSMEELETRVTKSFFALYLIPA